MAKRENHQDAPECAAFVESMRAAFGEVRVLHVREREFLLGQAVRYVNAKIFEIDAALKAAGRKRGKQSASD